MLGNEDFIGNSVGL